MSEGIIIAIITSVTSLIALGVTSVTNHKVRKQESLKKEIFEEIKSLRKEFSAGIESLRQTINNNRMKTLRNILVNELTQLVQGDKKSKEQVQDVMDMFEEYKNLGGDTYIDDLHEIWKSQQSKKGA